MCKDLSLKEKRLWMANSVGALLLFESGSEVVQEMS